MPYILVMWHELILGFTVFISKPTVWLAFGGVYVCIHSLSLSYTQSLSLSVSHTNMFLLCNNKLIILDTDFVNDVRHLTCVLSTATESFILTLWDCSSKDIISNFVNLFFKGDEKVNVSAVPTADPDNAVEFARSEKGN